VDMASFGAINYTVLIVYMAMMFTVGLWVRGKQETIEDYCLGGRRMPWFIVAMSMFASLASAISYMGLPARAFEENICQIVLGPASVLVAPLAICSFYPIYRRMNITTTYEYVNARYGRPARLAASGLFVLARLGWIGTVLYAPALAMSVVTGINVYLALLLMGLLATSYTALGGLSAVIWTDVFQFIILIGGAIWVAVSLTAHVPQGFVGIIETAREANHLIHWKLDFFQMNVVGMSLMGMLAFMDVYGTDQVAVQRLMAIKDFRGMARAAIMNSFYDLIVISLLLFVGLGLFAYYQEFPDRLDQELPADKLLPFYIMQTLPAGVSGLLITAIFAAAMSSMDSGINSLSTVVVNDFVRPFRRTSDRELDEVSLARWLTLALGVLAVAAGIFAAQIGHLLKVVHTIGSLFSVPILVLFLLGILSRRANFRGWLVGAVLSMATSLWIQNARFDVPMPGNQRTPGLTAVAQTFRVPAGSHQQRVVGTLNLSNVDNRENVAYRLLPNESNSAFQIDARSGQIRVSGKLDHIRNCFHLLEVEVVDQDIRRVENALVRLTANLHWSYYSLVSFPVCLVFSYLASLLFGGPLAQREYTLWSAKAEVPRTGES
jgi:SSS family solute:Na+ symporter